MANEFLTQEQLQDRVKASLERCADEAGVTLEGYFQMLADEWNAAIAKDDAEFGRNG